jgi:hypothetical protein
MKKALLALAYAVAGISACLVFGYIAIIVYINLPDRPIATDIRVNENWTEVRLKNPLTFNNRSQSLNLRIKDFTFDRNSNVAEIRFPDGTKINPEIEILDDRGNAVNMYHSGFAMKYWDAVVFTPPDTIRRNKDYRVIRIRSDIPFYCEGIYWIDYDPK